MAAGNLVAGFSTARWLWPVVFAGLLIISGAVWLFRPVGQGPAPDEQTLPRLSLSELLAGHSSEWRLARLRENPAVMVIEFPGLAEQGAAMNRLAAFLEKAGAPRDRVLDDSALAALIAGHGDNAQSFYQGHDYTDTGLARFFALARAQSIALSESEQKLRRKLIDAGLLSRDAEATGQGPQVLITFTAVQPDDPATPIDETIDAERRATVLRHEASHGRFYTSPAYREHCVRLWREVLTERQRESIRSYLAGIGYDRQNEELMLNEAQAFLMNTADVRAFNAAGVGMTEEELAELRKRFWQTLPAESVDHPNAWRSRPEQGFSR